MKCYNCKKEISDSALICPECGYLTLVGEEGDKFTLPENPLFEDPKDRRLLVLPDEKVAKTYGAVGASMARICDGERMDDFPVEAVKRGGKKGKKMQKDLFAVRGILISLYTGNEFGAKSMKKIVTEAGFLERARTLYGDDARDFLNETYAMYLEDFKKQGITDEMALLKSMTSHVANDYELKNEEKLRLFRINAMMHMAMKAILNGI